MTLTAARDASLLAATHSLAVDLVTAEVMRAFTDARVPSILLKGPSVALWLYPGGAGRGYVDSDLLVPPDHWAAAEQVLASLGFINLLAGTAPDEQDPSATPWQRPFDRGVVDLHRTLRGLGVPPSEAWSLLSARTEAMVVAGATVSVLTPAGRALNLALHAAHDGIGNRQCLDDLGRALDQLPSSVWDGAAALATRLAAESSFAAGLRLVPAGQALAARLRLSHPQSVEIRLRVTTPPPLALGFAALEKTPGWSAKLRFIAHNAFPTPAFMRFLSPMARRGIVGLTLAYVGRWIRLSRHVVPAYRAWRRVSVSNGQHG